MRIVEAQHLEDCFNGSAVFRYRTGQPWTPECIRLLERMGSLDYFTDFPRPYFRVRTPQGMEIKGIEGECACRVVFPKAGRELLCRQWEEFLANFVAPA